MLHVVLFEPQIPQNTGNIGRLCAVTKSRLHLIHPLGFTITDRHLKRSGMDYWKSLDVHHHENWEAFSNSPARPARVFMCTTKAQTLYWDARFQDGDGLLFGKESAGCPPWLHEKIGEPFRIRIPHENPDMRSLNLSTAAGVVTYEVLRQLKNLT